MSYKNSINSIVTQSQNVQNTNDDEEMIQEAHK